MQKSREKISALGRVSIFLNLTQRKNLLKTFINSQFGYCPLTGMFCGRKVKSRINHLHKRALRIVFENRDHSFHDLLKKDGS